MSNLTTHGTDGRAQETLLHPLSSPRPNLLCVHRAIERQVMRTPEATALSFLSESLTYRDLNERANRLAHHLRAMGVGPEVLVGLCTRRSIAMVVGLLAILKTGGAYLPLDPSHPGERLSDMLEDSQAPFLITEPCGLDRFDRFKGKLICLEREGDWIERRPASDLPGETAAGNLAYVIYTSGSTGRPKGVQIEHGSLANLLQSMRVRIGIGPLDSLLAVTTISFDIAALELFLPLIVGARIVLVDRDVASDGLRLSAALADSSITHFQATPATWRLLLEAGWCPRASLSMLCGGEALPRELANRLLHPEARLWNVYGPTETTIWSSTGAVEPGEGPVLLGKPIARTQFYVLDRQMRPVPRGVSGELYIGGAGLARGYLHRPGLTAERFVPDPFGDEPGGRLYRTGDTVRWRANGGLLYVGRTDHQVKIRGYRVEPAEVEAALLQHPAVANAVVTGRADASGETSLVAYLVVDKKSPLDQADLRDFVAALMPAYMVPSFFVLVDKLPLTPSGKVDRAGLPAFDAGRVRAKSPEIHPKSLIQATIANIWEETLGIKSVGIHEDFFSLGGHSLLATRVITRVREVFGIAVPLRTLFESPTVAGMAEHIEAFRHGQVREQEHLVLGADRTDPPALSLAQDSLWFLDQLDPDQATFNTYAAIRISGPLDREAFRRSLDAMVRRHESLRTTFRLVDGVPYQEIAESREAHIDFVDLRHLPSEMREAKARQRAVLEFRRPFDLSSGPLERITLLQLGDDEHAAILVMHHIITDGWSFGVVARELAELYASFHQGRPSPLPELKLQYADFTSWQRKQIASESWTSTIETMRQKLKDVPALALPLDHPRPPIRSSRGATQSVIISAPLSEAIRALSRRAGATSYMTLLAALQVLLGRWCGQVDFAIGTPAANRTFPETMNLIGYFVNMLVLRADLSGNPPIRQLLERTRTTAIEAFEHQEIPLELLIRTLKLDRDASRPPLFQVMFALQNNPLPEVGELGLTLSALDLEEGTGRSKFDLSLALGDGPEGFQGAIEYSAELFEPATIKRLAASYVRILEAIVADPDKRISELPILSREQREEILACSGRRHQNPPGKLIHELFESQAQRTPDERAIIARKGALSYSELDARANQLARLLLARGLRREGLVGMLLGGAINRITSVLGVLKAGGTYVPLDSDSPLPRLEEMLVHADLQFLIVDHQMRSRLPSTDASVLDLDASENQLGTLSSEHLAVPLGGENLAYVIFTSGSTGRPKGVMIRHAGLVAAAQAWKEHYGLSRPGLRHLQAAAFSFDVYAGDWVRALTTGGTLVDCPKQVLVDPAQLARLIAEERIDCMELVPAVAEVLATTLERQGGNLHGVRLLAIGSDTLSERLYHRLTGLVGPGGRVVNSYGLTEATIDSTFFEGDVDDEPGARLPIGRPMAGTLTYVLDHNLELIPEGAAGELYVGGAGVARGYLSDPRLTADRFVPDPHGEPGTRLYRTGDLARWRPGGVLELVGRTDHQVKVRGHRVELAEIEAVLCAHPEVREAAVVTRQGDGGSTQLVAFVALKDSRSTTLAQLRLFLRDRLPRPMIPAVLSLIDRLPTLSSGKIDRQRLASLQADPAPDAEEIVAPRDELEARLLSIWEAILEIRPISINADFFDLGGHSLLAVRLATKIEEELGRALPLSTLLLGTSIAAIAEHLREPEIESTRTPLVNLRSNGTGRPLFLVHPIGGSVSCYLALARCLEGSRRVYAFQAPGLDGEAPPETSIENMAARYVDSISQDQVDGPPILAAWSMGGVIAMEMACQIFDARGELPLLILIDSRAPSGSSDWSVDDPQTVFKAFVADLAQTASHDVRRELSRIPELDLETLAQQHHDVSTLADTLLPQVGSRRLRQLLEVYQAHLRALNRYRPRLYPGRVVLIRPDRSTNCPPHDPCGGWDRWVPAGITTHTIHGDHYSIMQPPAISELAAVIDREIARV